MISTNWKSQVGLNWKTSLMVGNQQQRNKMEISGKCHKERKTFFSKNLIAAFPSANFRYHPLKKSLIWSIKHVIIPLQHMLFDVNWYVYLWCVQIASFIKQHIFSRRRPIDGWRYMIEVIGPNARKGKGSVSRLPALSDVSTQPFKEESGSLSTFKRRSNRDLWDLRRSEWQMTVVL